MNKKFLTYTLTVILSFGFSQWAYSAEKKIMIISKKATISNCNDHFDNTGQCPREACDFRCIPIAGSEDRCVMTCLDKSCLYIEPEDCPLNRCQVLKGCDDKEACYHRLAFTPNCGGIGYPGQDVQCCKGMVKKCGIEFFDGSCDMVAKYTPQGVPVCMPCGNGICNQFENRCNCPEDCVSGYREMLRRQKSKKRKVNIQNFTINAPEDEEEEPSEATPSKIIEIVPQ